MRPTHARIEDQKIGAGKCFRQQFAVPLKAAIVDGWLCVLVASPDSRRTRDAPIARSPVSGAGCTRDSMQFALARLSVGSVDAIVSLRTCNVY
jgi:hypothetical protein